MAQAWWPLSRSRKPALRIAMRPVPCGGRRVLRAAAVFGIAVIVILPHLFVDLLSPMQGASALAAGRGHGKGGGQGGGSDGGHGNGVGNGGGNGVGNGSDSPGNDGAGQGNAYGRDSGGDGPGFGAGGGSAGADSAFGQGLQNGNGAADKWDSATKIDSGVDTGKLLELEKLKESAGDYLGATDFPGKADPPGLTADKVLSEPAGKTSAPGQTGEKPDHDPQGKAVGHHRDDTADDLAAGATSALAGASGAQRAEKKTQGGIPAVIEPGSYSHHEVLAIDLSPEGISRARSLGFHAAFSSSFAGGYSVTVLTTPHGVDALHALKQLERELPGGGFHLNRLYEPFRPAVTRDVVGQRTRPATLGNAAPCTGDHCYARTVIRWKTEFAGCAAGVRVGVIDTAVDQFHPAFKGQAITFASFLPEGQQASQDRHGTGVLAILAGRPDSGTPGLIPRAKFFAASIFFTGDNGETHTDTISLLRALEWMSASGVKLINMSFTGPRDELVRSRIARLSEEGTVFSAAAGNGGPSGRASYPAAYPQVIAVTAINSNLQLFPFATRGSYIDLAAPGVHIWTAIPGAREGYRSGTSFAAPFATAVLAILPGEMLRMPKGVLVEKISAPAPVGGERPWAAYSRGLLQAPRTCVSRNDDITSRGHLNTAPGP